MKTIEELQKEEERIQKLLDSGVREQLMKIPGVVHVSLGLKESNGFATDEFSIRVYVEEKKDKNQLPSDQIIPAVIEGIKTDINQVPVARKLIDNLAYTPLRGGIQIQGAGAGFGTLGCLATDSTGNTVLLTCQHVLATVGQQVFQPAVVGGTLIGTVSASVLNNAVDCAMATIAAGVATGTIMNNLKIPINGVASAVTGARVYKSGRTTGLTRGKVIDTSAAVTVSGYPAGNQNFTGVLKIQSLFKYTTCCCCACYEQDSIFRFSDQGDSGSVIVMSNGKAVGLLFADNEGPGGLPGFAHETYGCALTAVQTALNITVNNTTADTGDQVPDVSSAHLESAITPSRVNATDTSYNLLSDLEQELRTTESGTQLLKFVYTHRKEVLELINHKRPVTITWHKNQGPAFTAHFMNSIKDPQYVIPEQVKGISLRMLTMRMAAILEEYGSLALKKAINEYALDLIYYAEDCSSTKALLLKLKSDIVV